MQQLLARHVQRQCAAPIDRAIRLRHVEHGANERLVVAAEIQHGGLRRSLGRKFGLPGRRGARRRARVCLRVDAQHRLHHGSAIEAEQGPLGDVVAGDAVPVERSGNLVGHMGLRDDEGVVRGGRPAPGGRRAGQRLDARHPRVRVGKDRVAQPERVRGSGEAGGGLGRERAHGGLQPGAVEGEFDRRKPGDGREGAIVIRAVASGLLRPSARMLSNVRASKRTLQPPAARADSAPGCWRAVGGACSVSRKLVAMSVTMAGSLPRCCAFVVAPPTRPTPVRPAGPWCANSTPFMGGHLEPDPLSRAVSKQR